MLVSEDHYFCTPQKFFITHAEVAHLVERDLAKVEVAGSSPVFRSQTSRPRGIFFSPAPVVELVDTQDLKSCSPQREYGFNSRLGHSKSRFPRAVFLLK